MEIFGILELVLPIRIPNQETEQAILKVDNQKLEGEWSEEKGLRFRFCPKSAKSYHFTVQFNSEVLEDLKGGITVVAPNESLSNKPATALPNWWVDDLALVRAEGVHHGAKSVSCWREDFLSDFAQRMERCSGQERE